MLFSLVFFAVFFTALGDDFLSFDYCSLNCKDSEHSACHCTRKPPRREILDDPPLIEFRKKILHEHNYWRNYVAGGEEKRPTEGYCPTAKNMMLMNYDMELEHISRCRAINSYRHSAEDTTGHDTCHNTMNNGQLGQNLAGSTVYNGTFFSSVWGWYEEVNDIAEDTISKMGGEFHKIGHFTQIMWAKAHRLGCVRVENTDNLEVWRFTLICHYGSDYGVPGNQAGVSVYEQGTPCEECFGDSKCDPSSAYPNLCGTLLPIPEDGVTASSPQVKIRNTMFVIVLIVLVLIY